MAKNILLPTDFSENSKAAIAYALNLYSGVKTRYFLLHTYLAPHAGASVLVSIEDILKEDAEKELKAMQSRILGQIGEENFVQIILERGDLNYAIERAVDLWDIDAIVMGTKGASGIKEVLVGSNAFKVMQVAKVPVWVIPNDVEIRMPKRIGLASDLSHTKDIVLKPLTELKERVGCEVLLVNVQKEAVGGSSTSVSSGKYIQELVSSIFSISGDEVQESLRLWAKKENIDVLAVVRYKHSFLDHLFGRSNTRKLAMASEIPLLVLKGQR